MEVADDDDTVVGVALGGGVRTVGRALGFGVRKHADRFLDGELGIEGVDAGIEAERVARASALRRE